MCLPAPFPSRRDLVADEGETEVTASSFDAALATGIEPDGVFMGGDMAYVNGTFWVHPDSA